MVMSAGKSPDELLEGSGDVSESEGRSGALLTESSS